MKNCGSPITQGIQAWVGQVFEQHDLVKDGFVHGGGGGLS